MSLVLDGSGNITANDTATYTWENIVALNSSKLDIYGDTSKPVYRWRGIIDAVNATINIQNIDIELYGASTTEPGIIRATGTGSIVFGDNTGTRAKNGCNIKITRKYYNSQNNNTFYSPLTYCTVDNDKFKIAPKIKIYNSRLFISSLTLMPNYGSRISLFISELVDSIVSLEAIDTANAKGMDLYMQPSGLVSNVTMTSLGINLLNTTTISNYITVDTSIPVNTYAGAYFFTQLYLEVSDVQSFNNTYSYYRDQCTGFIFLNSSTINLANGLVGAVENYYPFAECQKTFSHDLKIIDINGNVNNALISYSGKSNLNYTSNSSGIVNTFKLVTEETNVQSLGFPGNYTNYPTPVPVINYSTYNRIIKSYLHLPVNETITVSSQIGSSTNPFLYSLNLDSGITQIDTTIVAGYTGISHTTTTITINQLITLNEIYDSRKLYWRNNTGVNAPYLETDVLNLNGANLVVDGVNLVSSSKFKSITTTGTITYLNNGNTSFSSKDSNGFRFRIYGLPTKSNSFPVIRIKKINDNITTNPTVTNGEVYVYLVEGENYEVRADARGFIASNFITINTNTSSELQITLKEILDSNNNPVYGNGIQQQKDLIIYDSTNNIISIAYSSAYPTININSAVDKLEEILATTTGLELPMHPVYLNGKLVFIRNILTNAQSTIKIKPATGNTGDPELLFELVREGDNTPYNLFDFSNSNGRIIKYPTTVNVANFTGQVTIDSTQIANDVWASNTRTLTSYLTTTQQNQLNNLDVAVSTRLAATAYNQAPTVTDIRQELSTELSRIDVAVSSRATSANVWTNSNRSLTEGVIVTTNNDKTNYELSSNSINNIWNTLVNSLTVVGSIGKRIIDYLDTTISSRLSASNYINAPTITDIRNALPELNRIDTTISSRSSQTSVDAKPSLTNIESSTVLAKESTLNIIANNALTSSNVNTIITNALNNIEVSGLNTDQNNKLTQISNDVLKLKKLRGLSGVSVIAKAPTSTTPGYLKTSDNDINLVITKIADEEILSD